VEGFFETDAEEGQGEQWQMWSWCVGGGCGGGGCGGGGGGGGGGGDGGGGGGGGGVDAADLNDITVLNAYYQHHVGATWQLQPTSKPFIKTDRYFRRKMKGWTLQDKAAAVLQVIVGVGVWDNGGGDDDGGGGGGGGDDDGDDDDDDDGDDDDNKNDDDSRAM
jgi:hypothetical protein